MKRLELRVRWHSSLGRALLGTEVDPSIGLRPQVREGCCLFAFSIFLGSDFFSCSK